MAKEKYGVLVVDDDPSVLVTMAAILENEFRVRATGSARQGLDWLRDGDYHVVVADWQMPEMDGVAFLSSVGDAQQVVACLLVTGHVDELALEVPWDDRRTLALLRKPFDPRVLVSRVQHLARLSAMKRSSVRLRDAASNLRSGD